MSIYPKVSSSPNFNEVEENILKYWKENSVFEYSVSSKPAKENGKNNEFIFYDGPPFANGLPHYGHLLTGFIKDTVARYQTQKGKKVERRFGWDCHGLPAEMGAEKELKISGRASIMQYGIDKFNDHCRSSVLKYTHEWETYVTRQARWVDFKNDYKTMDTTFMESVIWAFKQLYDKGLVYQSMRVMPYSWACETPLSNFETKLDNSYRERADKSATVLFELINKPNSVKSEKPAFLLAWTTTPWTLPSNLAIAAGAEVSYVAVEEENRIIILGSKAVSKYKKELGDEPKIIAEFKGEELRELKYKPLFDYFKDHANSFRVLIGDFVTDEDGTGMVHLAPGFGEDDQIICEKEGIELVCPVDSGGKFTAEVWDYKGIQVFDTIDEIIKALKEKNLWLKTEQFLHNYPHCWRTDTPLIYKAMPSWYVEVTKFKDRMVELNQQISWIPGHIKDGLFGNWLANARDWSISRNRFWGTPIPVWMSDNPKYPRVEVYGSIKELEEAFGVKVKDLHRPFIDELVKPNPDDPTGKSMMRRVEDVFDCWFESGSMPYAQVHYPFENKDWFETHFPADFIVEYTAQTRGWFYTLMVLSTALFDRPPFLNCICHGVILDDKGQKLSKRLNNYADPKDIFKNYGADTLRWLMLSSPVMRGLELLIDKDGNMLKDVQRLSIKPIWNSYHFFTLYANADNIKAEFSYKSENELDRYILSKLHETVKVITESLDIYDTITACSKIEEFYEVLNNWYIRRNRPRFWRSGYDSDKQNAYNTLFTVLVTMSKVSASILPLVSEAIYLGLHNSQMQYAKESVHLTNMPQFNEIPYDHMLVTSMDRVRDICNAALSIRSNNNIRVRQPLKALFIIGNKIDVNNLISLIEDEINVKMVVFEDDINKHANYKLQLHFPVLGKRLPEKMKDITKEMKAGNWFRNDDGTINVGEIKIEKDEFKLLLEPKNPKDTASLSTQDAIVVLDLNISEELYNEGVARDLVRLVQQSRKDEGFDVSDKVLVKLNVSDKLKPILTEFTSYIEEQTLSKLEFTNEQGKLNAELEEEKLTLSIVKL